MPRSAAQLALAWDETRSSALASKQAKEAPGRLHMSALRFNSMHFMPYAHLPENHKELQIALGGFLQQELRSGQGLRPLSALSSRNWCSPISSASTPSSSTSITTPSYSMMAAPNLIAAAAHPANQERAHLRLGHAAQLHAAEPPRRRIRHARCDVGRPPRSCVPARHRHGVLGQPDQSGDRARTLPGVAQDHPSGVA